jgi:hypothetical protein
MTLSQTPQPGQRGALATLAQLDELALGVGDLHSRVVTLKLPDDVRDSTRNYPTQIRESLQALSSEIAEFHANLVDDLAGMTEFIVDEIGARLQLAQSKNQQLARSNGQLRHQVEQMEAQLRDAQRDGGEGGANRE